MKTSEPLKIDALEALTAAVVLTEAFMSLPIDQLPPAVNHGIVLLYDTAMQRLRPALPPDVPEIQATMAAARRTVNVVRDVYGLPPVV